MLYVCEWFDISDSHISNTNISVDADGPHDAASRPIDHIELHTDLAAECDVCTRQQGSVDIKSTFLHSHKLTAVGC